MGACLTRFGEFSDSVPENGQYIPGMISRRDWLRASVASAAGLLVARDRLFAAAPALPVVTVYKDPGCECCGKWVKHLSANGFVTMVQNTSNMDEVKHTMHVPTALQSCHTAVVGPYVVEGHVPADLIKKMLAQKPAIVGLAAPGMPSGAPGMETGAKPDKYDIIAWERSGKTHVYASR